MCKNQKAGNVEKEISIKGTFYEGVVHFIIFEVKDIDSHQIKVSVRNVNGASGRKIINYIDTC